MNYLKHYIALIRKRQKDVVQTGERHHVFPQCIFGKNKVLVKLTIREHFVAHKLLYKICQKRYGNRHNRTIRMLFALRHMMSDKRNNDSRKNASMIVSSKLLEKIRKIHPTMLPGVGEKISKAKKGVPVPALQGENNPSKKPGVGDKISKSKLGKQRMDLKGKSYFGASPENIKNGIEKMRLKKIGKKIENYPKNRKSVPCSPEKAKKLSESKAKVDANFIKMSSDEFEAWVKDKNLYRKDGIKNTNITRILVLRGIDVDHFYKERKNNEPRRKE